MDNLNRVLYVRVADDILKGLDALAKQEKQKHPGRKVTRSDVARTILHKAIQVRGRKK